MGYGDADLLQLSGLQHFAFCRRQWALIHIEDQWTENWRTADGRLLHKNAHDAGFREKRGDILIIRGLRVVSRRLGISGQCDVVEFHRSVEGVELNGEEGLWIPYPIEYKRGRSKAVDADSLQLCAQAMCLEEILCCSVEEGALFYGEIKRRHPVIFGDELRCKVECMLEEMHSMYKRGYTPKAKPSRGCGDCSMKGVCLPSILRKDVTAKYLKEAMEDKT